MSQNNLQELTKLIRYNILTSTSAAGSGHPTSSLSAVEMMTTLFFDGHMHYDWEHPDYIFNDRFVLSKGHAAPVLYSVYQAAGAISRDELLSLRKFTSNVEGHPTPRLKWVDVSTGSLGQGLSVGLGMALGIKQQLRNYELEITNEEAISGQANNKFKRGRNLSREPKVWVLMGDSEFVEGQIWEAMQIASYYKVNNLVGLLDVNRLGQRGETMLGWDIETYEKRISAMGWDTIVIENGNDLESVRKAFHNVETRLITSLQKPTMIIAKTRKGAGIKCVSDLDDWHGKALPEDKLKEALEELGTVDLELKGKVSMPERITNDELPMTNELTTSYQLPATKMATREAYGQAIKMIAEDKNVVVLDAETSNSTYAQTMKEVDPDRFYEMYIAEQNMVSVALGMSKVGLTPFASSFAAFLARAYDQIRMSQYSEPNVNIVGSHAGISIGADGSSQMALEDIAMMRGLLESIVLYPSDTISTLKLVKQMYDTTGLKYLRLTREKTEHLYSENDEFPIGGSKVLRSSSDDKAVIIAAGITVHESLKAYEKLKAKGINVAVIDAYSVKPMDTKTIREHAEKTGHVIVVEDHYPDGGLGDAVRQALDGMAVKFTHLPVTMIPRSGEPDELLSWEKIDAEAIIEAVRK